MDNRIKELQDRKDAQIAEVEDDWDDETGVYDGIPDEPTRKQNLREVQEQLNKAFGSNESRTLELDPEIWMDLDITVDDEDTEITGG